MSYRPVSSTAVHDASPAAAIAFDSPAFAALPRFLRVLLTADGTVTTSLEAYFAEPIRIEPETQTLRTHAQAQPLLELPAGTQVIDRRVRLRGGTSNRVYAYAESLLRPDALPTAIRADILAGRIGIGELLRDRALPSFREIVALGARTDGAALFLDPQCPQCCEAIFRTYRIFLDRAPAILITEYFPRALYEEAA